MKRLFRILPVLIILNSLFIGCKKYPEDHKRYLFKSPEKRIQGGWLLTKYYMNNGDSTTFLYNQYIGYNSAFVPNQYTSYNSAATTTNPPQYGNLVLETGDSETKGRQYGITMYSIGGVGYMNFENHKNSIEIEFSVNGTINSSTPNPYISIPTLYNPFINISNWDIRELTNTDFKIENTINNINYRIEFKKQ